MHPRLLLVVVALLVAGCAKPQPRPRTLDEIYTLTERVNATAEPYDLGTGDGLGAQTYTIYREEGGAD